MVIGDQIRNWSLLGHSYVLKPYDDSWKLCTEDKTSGLFRYLRIFRAELGGRATFGGKAYDEAREPWFRFHQMSVEKITAPTCIVYPEISTHSHFKPHATGTLFTQTAPVVRLQVDNQESYFFTTGLLNSSAALFWLKQVCFNKGAGEDEERDRFEFAAGKIRQLPVPENIATALRGTSNVQAKQMCELSRVCWKHGEKLSGLGLRSLFDESSEAYYEWNSTLPGYVAPNAELGPPFESIGTLRKAYKQAQAIRDRLRSEMIAIQEEIDWLVYAAYGLLSTGHPAAQPDTEPSPLDRDQRPFCLWAQAAEDFAGAVKLIPSDWPPPRKKLWEARLAAIRDNEHIRRIEQPVYKRRWDEQWKVGNQWRCGPIAYAAEFVDAFEWWLREKAEWWIEHRKNAGSVEFEEWAQALWKHARIQAAWPVAAEEYARLEYEKARKKAEENGEAAPTASPLSANFSSFKQGFRSIVDEETVPEGFPFGTPYEELEKKLKKAIPGKVRKVRGKLNVPRERFHLRGKSLYLWAGLQFK